MSDEIILQSGWVGSSELARPEVLARLLALNHQRYEGEQRMKDEGGRMKGKGRKQGAESKKAKGKQAGKGQLGFEI